MKLKYLLMFLLLGAGCAKKAQVKADAQPTETPPLDRPTELRPPTAAVEPTRYDDNPYLLLEEPDGRGERDLVSAVVRDASKPTTQWVEATDALKEEAFDPTRHLTQSADLAFMNLENPITTLQPSAEKTYAFTSDPGRLDWYFGAGFNMYSLANNHIADAERVGIDRTIKSLEQYAKKHDAPLYYAGAGTTPEEGLGPKYFKPEGKDLTIAFFSLGFSRSDNVGKFWDEKLEEKIKEADAKADIVFVSVHVGREYKHVPEKDLQECYRSWVDWGAECVWCPITRCIQPVEAYGDGLIFDLVGNFVFMSRTIRHRKVGAKLYGMMGRIVLKDGEVFGTQIVPTWVNNSDDRALDSGETMPNANFVPQILTGPFAKAYFDDLERWTEKAGATQIEVIGDRGYVTLPEPDAANETSPEDAPAQAPPQATAL